MLIDIFHDTVCPWCRIGKKYLFDALAQWKGKAAQIRWHPFLLDDTVPPEGVEFRSFMQAKKSIGQQALSQMFDYTRQAGELAGVKLDFDKISLAVNTKLSHRLITLAPEEIKHTVVEAVYQAYFEDGLNIGNLDVLMAIASDVGMDANETKRELNNPSALDAVVAETTFARLNGINSVPLFILNHQVWVDGSHSVEVFQQALMRAALLESDFSKV